MCGQPFDLANFGLKFVSDDDGAEFTVESANSVELLVQQSNSRPIHATSGVE